MFIFIHIHMHVHRRMYICYTCSHTCLHTHYHTHSHAHSPTSIYSIQTSMSNLCISMIRSTHIGLYDSTTQSHVQTPCVLHSYRSRRVSILRFHSSLFQFESSNFKRVGVAGIVNPWLTWGLFLKGLKWFWYVSIMKHMGDLDGYDDIMVDYGCLFVTPWD